LPATDERIGWSSSAAPAKVISITLAGRGFDRPGSMDIQLDLHLDYRNIVRHSRLQQTDGVIRRF
jgi:hypothetical protein